MADQLTHALWHSGLYPNPNQKTTCLVTTIHYFQKAFLKYISRQDSYNTEAKKDNNILFK
jgi:hypothetical protein